MMFSMLLFLVTSLFAAVPVDADYHLMQERDFYPDNGFRTWIDKHYDDLKRLGTPGLKPKEHYYGVVDNKKDWIAKRAQTRIKTNLDEIYGRMDAKIIKPVGTYYYRKGKSKRTLYIVPVPHLAYPTEYPILMKRIYDRFPDDHIVYLQNFRFINSDKFRNEQQLAKDLKLELTAINSAWNLGATEKNFFVICNATPYVNEFFSQNPDLYRRVIYFSPMVSNLDKGRLFKEAELHPGAKTFNVFDLFYIYFNILLDERSVPLFWSMKEFFAINLPTYDYYMGLYDKGLDMSKIKPKYVIVGDKDPLVTPRNSMPQLFDESYVVKGGDHLSPLVGQIDELMNVMEKFMNKKDQR